MNNTNSKLNNVYVGGSRVLNRSCLQRRAEVKGNIQSRHRAPPQHHLRGLRGGDGVKEGVGKILRTKRRGFLCTVAETASRTGPRAGTKPTTERT